MKIAITSTGGSMDSLVSEKFGRCQYFLIIDSDTMKFEAFSNLGEQMQSGAGPKAAELLIKHGAKVVLTGHVGGNANDALARGGIKIIDGFSGKEKVKDAIEQFISKTKSE